MKRNSWVQYFSLLVGTICCPAFMMGSRSATAAIIVNDSWADAGRTDGAEIELLRIVLLRGLPQWIVSAIPVVNLLTLVDVLFIFGSARRCVHDYIAGTIVVKTPSKAPARA